MDQDPQIQQLQQACAALQQRVAALEQAHQLTAQLAQHSHALLRLDSDGYIAGLALLGAANPQGSAFVLNADAAGLSG